jgi:hypothetical protein
MSLSNTRWHLAALAILLALQGACVADANPPIAACHDIPGHAGGDLSRGRLSVIPSTVEGVEIDSAAWFTDAHTVDLGAEAILVFTARLAISEPADINDLALIYHVTGGSEETNPIFDLDLAEPIYSASDAELERRNNGSSDERKYLRPGDRARTERIRDVEMGMRTSRRLPFDGCPASVQLVKRRDIALYAGSGRAWAGLRGDALRQRVRLTSAAGAAVVWDTTLQGGPVITTQAGIVANLSADTITGRVVRLTLAADSAPSPLTTPSDTLIYPLPAIPPGSVAGFAGRAPDYGKRVVSREIVPAADGRAATGPSEAAGGQ